MHALHFLISALGLLGIAAGAGTPMTRRPDSTVSKPVWQAVTSGHINRISELQAVAKEYFEWVKDQSNSAGETGSCIVSSLYDPLTGKIYSSTIPRDGKFRDDMRSEGGYIAPVWYDAGGRADHYHAEDGCYYDYELQNDQEPGSTFYTGGKMIASYGYILPERANAPGPVRSPCGGSRKTPSCSAVATTLRVKWMDGQTFDQPATNQPGSSRQGSSRQGSSRQGSSRQGSSRQGSSRQGSNQQDYIDQDLNDEDLSNLDCSSSNTYTYYTGTRSMAYPNGNIVQYNGYYHVLSLNQYFEGIWNGYPHKRSLAGRIRLRAETTSTIPCVRVVSSSMPDAKTSTAAAATTTAKDSSSAQATATSAADTTSVRAGKTTIEAAAKATDASDATDSKSKPKPKPGSSTEATEASDATDSKAKSKPKPESSTEATDAKSKPKSQSSTDAKAKPESKPESSTDTANAKTKPKSQSSTDATTEATDAKAKSKPKPQSSKGKTGSSKNTGSKPKGQ